MNLAAVWSGRGGGDRVVLQCGDAFVSCMTSAERGNESSCSVERPIVRGDRVVLQCGDAFVFVYEGG